MFQFVGKTPLLIVCLVASSWLVSGCGSVENEAVSTNEESQSNDGSHKEGAILEQQEKSSFESRLRRIKSDFDRADDVKLWLLEKRDGRWTRTPDSGIEVPRMDVAVVLDGLSAFHLHIPDDVGSVLPGSGGKTWIIRFSVGDKYYRELAVSSGARAVEVHVKTKRLNAVEWQIVDHFALIQADGDEEMWNALERLVVLSTYQAR